MRGYRRRHSLSYLAGVAAAVLLLTQLGGDSLRPPPSALWGLFVTDDGSVRRVAEGSPAAEAGIRTGDAVLAAGGAPWLRPWERHVAQDGTLRVDLIDHAGNSRSVRLSPSPHPRGELVRRAVMAFVAVCFTLTGLVVFLSRSDRVATLFFFMCMLFARLILPGDLPNGRIPFLVDKIFLDLANLVLPAVVLHFFLCFPQRAGWLQRNGKLAWLLYVPAIVGMPIAVAYDLDVVLAGAPISAAALAFQRIMALIFVGMIVWGVVTLVRGVRTVASPVLRRSVKWVLPGTALGILPPLLLAAILNLFHSVEIPGDRYAFITLALVPISFAHGIIRYGLMDLELVAKRSVVYTTLTALLIALYWFAAETVGRVFISVAAPGRTVVSFAVVFAAALLFVPVRDRVQSFVDRSLYRKRYSYRRTLQEFSRLFATFLEQEELVRLLVERLPMVLGTERVALFVRSSREESLHLAGTKGIGALDVPLPLFTPSEALLDWWREADGPVPVGSPNRTDRFDRLSEEEQVLFDGLDPEVLVFLPRERALEGLLVLGAKEGGESYHGEDLELLSTLGDQAGTALSSSRLHEEALERRRMEEELAVAKRIQASLLPSEVPRRDGVEIAAVTRPCHEVGGDFYDFLDFGADGIGLAVADVSGKGVPAALILSGLQATLRAEARPREAPEPIVRKINRRLCQDVSDGSFASLLYAHLDVEASRLSYVNAGHPAGLVVRRDGSVERLDEGGMLLGVEREAVYRAGERTFAAGDLLLLYSDGVTDVLNEADEEYGAPRLEALLPRLVHLSTDSLLENVIASVEAFVGGALPDDITLLVAKFLPRGQQPEIV
jgi:phosphoserine phosphatase RsbU/P